jgi:putative colanic acid biosynthesis acetyltransferase WcaF
MAHGQKVQDLGSFRLPDGFRGRPAWFVQLWWLIHATLFAWSPQFMYAWRRCLLRLFGARVGRNVQVRPTAEITYPWKVKIGDWTWIGDRVVLYSLGEIEIGSNVVVSQNSYLCAGTHDYTVPSFDISGPQVRIEDQAWLASDVFVGPGVTIGSGTVVGARSSVFHDLPPLKVCRGNPARPVHDRQIAPQ